MTPRSRPALPLVVFCVDAGDPDLLVRWAEAGHLPVLRRLMAQGWWARTGGPELAVEHGAWTALLSGVSRARHGYHYFRQLRAGSYDLDLVAGFEVEAPPFWADLPAGTRVAIVDVPDTQPLPHLGGVQLCDWAVHNPEREPVGHPDSVLDTARRVFGPPEPIEEHIGSTEAEDRALYERLLARISRKGALVRALVADANADLVVAAFGETHTGGHQLWKYRAGNQSGQPDGLLTHALRELYAATDRELGLLLDAVGEANVVVLSSVGLRDQFPMEGLGEALLRTLGYQASPPRRQDGLRPLALARRLLPERARVWLSRRLLSRAQREALLAEQFRTGTDWGRTTAFAVPSAYATLVRVNLRGREPEGTVAPADYDALLDRVEADFRALLDPATGEPAVEQIDRTATLFGPGASPALPDLIVHWKPVPRFVRRLKHPRATLRQGEPEFFRDSDHTRHGFIAAAGPAFERAGDAGELDALAVAPLLRAAVDAQRPLAVPTHPPS